MTIEYFIAWFGVVFPLIFSPGPANIVFALSGAKQGVRKSMPLLLGVDLVYILCSLIIGFGLGVMVSDINGDLYPDIYVTNDFYERDYLYINNQDGTFTESIKDWASHINISAMGVDMADINNDGNIDIFVTDMLPEKDKRIKSVMEFEGYNIFKLKLDIKSLKFIKIK